MTNKALKLIFILIIATGLSACTYPAKATERTAVYDLPLNAGVKDAAFLSNMEKDIITRLNEVRTNPGGYVEWLKGLRDKPGWTEGLEKAIVFLENTKPLPAFRLSKGLSLAARDLVNDHGPKGLTGHTGSDGTSPFDRMNRYGQWEGKATEILSYGYREADAVVARIAIDAAAIPNDQTQYLFDKGLLTAGVACGPHKTNGIMCSVNFAHTYKEKK